MKIVSVNFQNFCNTNFVNIAVAKNRSMQSTTVKMNNRPSCDMVSFSKNQQDIAKYEIKPVEVGQLKKEFKKTYGKEPEHVVFAPGRSIFIGEHTDYHEGLVVPFAIDGGTTVGVAKRKDSLVKIYSKNQDAVFEFDLAKEPDIEGYKNGRYRGRWGNYAEGTIRNIFEKIEEYSEGLKPIGLNIYLEGNVPSTGLSSSASLEMSIAKAMLCVYKQKLTNSELAQIGKQSEHDYAGANCGLMDQLTSVSAKKNSVLSMDCEKQAVKIVPANFGKDLNIVICCSGVEHKLFDSPFNERVAESRLGYQLLKENFFPQTQNLCQIEAKEFLEKFDEIKEVLSEKPLKRVTHVILENERTKQAIESFEKGDYAKIGELMGQTHESLKDNMEVSCPELNKLVDIANVNGAIGSKMTGGGFGGSTINLVPTKHLLKFINAIESEYKTSAGNVPKIFIVKPSEGAHEIKS